MEWEYDTHSEYGVIRVEVEKKKIKRLNMHFRTDGVLAVSVPVYTKDDRTRRFVSDHNEWIVRQLKKREQYLSQEQKKDLSVSGEVRYLGKRYKLVLVEGAPKVDVVGDLFAVFAPSGKHDAVLKKWWRERARELFTEDLDTLFERIFRPLVKRKPDLTVKNMTSRWGSCNHVKYHINMNENLIKADRECVEYVMLHELTHLIHPDHSKRFYAFIAAHMPDYREREKRLKQVNKK